VEAKRKLEERKQAAADKLERSQNAKAEALAGGGTGDTAAARAAAKASLPASRRRNSTIVQGSGELKVGNTTEENTADATSSSVAGTKESEDVLAAAAADQSIARVPSSSVLRSPGDSTDAMSAAKAKLMRKAGVGRRSSVA
jgi:hypothetical protein